MTKRWMRVAVPAAVVAALTCGLGAAPPAITFSDVTAAAGVAFTHNSGRAGKK